eukprot:3895422-Alexandrium_andersonii.AAC.1
MEQRRAMPRHASRQSQRDALRKGGVRRRSSSQRTRRTPPHARWAGGHCKGAAAGALRSKVQLQMGSAEPSR